MSTTAQIVAIIAGLASLYLVTRGWFEHGHSRQTTIKIALIWCGIIAGVALLVRFLGA